MHSATENRKSTKLSLLLCGESGIVQDVKVEGPLGQRLMDLGFYPGARVQIVRNAPLVDPVKVSLDGTLISLRHAEADCVEVCKI